MIPKVFKEVIDLGDGREISIETGKLAKQAHGSVVVQSGKCMLLCTVVSNYKQSDVDFLPLTVDYREKFAAAGRYPGGFFKREARPSDGEVLTMRLVDRVLRPLFPKDYHSETQVMIQLMSHDEDVMPDAMAGLAASAAIQLSDFPFECAISEVRVGRVNGEFVINPTRAQLKESDIDMMIGASADSVMMVEGEMNEVSEAIMLEGIKVAHEEIKRHCLVQKELDLLINYDFLENIRLDRVRDLFTFACFTGLRISDVINLTKANVKNGFIYLNIIKSSQNSGIPLTKHALAILEKYNYKLPKISGQKINDYLKEIGKLIGIDEEEQVVTFKAGKRLETFVPRYELLSSHVGRRTFITLSIMKGIPTPVIQSITGHQDLKSFQKYIQLNNNDKMKAMKLWD